MNTQYVFTDTQRYARCIDASRRIRWDIDKDVFRNRQFDLNTKFLPDGLSRTNELTFLTDAEKRLISQIQGRTYANIFGLVERFICAKVLEVSHDHFLGDQVALEALVRFSDEELKHQEMFRRINQMIGERMPEGYRLVPKPNEVASVVLQKSTWAVLALTCHIELFTQAHYKESIESDNNLSELYKDVFLYHWKEESQHAIMDELEWRREDEKLTSSQRDQAVQDLIELVSAVDGILVAQAQADTEYYLSICGYEYSQQQAKEIQDTVLKAYRWQYIVSGVEHPKFIEVLSSLVNREQLGKIVEALTPIIQMVKGTAH